MIDKDVWSLKMNDLLWLNYKTRLNITNKWRHLFRMLKRAQTLNYRLINAFNHSLICFRGTWSATAPAHPRPPPAPSATATSPATAGQAAPGPRRRLLVARVGVHGHVRRQGQRLGHTWVIPIFLKNQLTCTIPMGIYYRVWTNIL